MSDNEMDTKNERYDETLTWQLVYNDTFSILLAWWKRKDREPNLTAIANKAVTAADLAIAKRREYKQRQRDER